MSDAGACAGMTTAGSLRRIVGRRGLRQNDDANILRRKEDSGVNLIDRRPRVSHLSATLASLAMSTQGCLNIVAISLKNNGDEGVVAPATSDWF
jgi:hypothetical protein